MYTNAVDSAMTFADTALMSSENFRIMLDEAHDWAERSGLKEKDVNDIIKDVRRKKNGYKKQV